MTALNGLSLQGRTALVAGAASGIGHATAVLLAQAGAAVVSHIICNGGRAWMVEPDVSDASAVTFMVDELQAKGSVDILVNNAGIIQEKPFLETTEADWDRMLGVDLKSVFMMCRAFLSDMVARRSGTVVNIASDLDLLGRANFAPYCASKAGIIGLTRALAREFVPAVRINAVAPGPVDTAMVSLDCMSPETSESELAIPQRRFARPEEIAASVLFLVRDLSGDYCGQVLGPNGGSVMP
jgi:3-oxoacyl-[acyl-carrier protein] reductase